VVKTPEGLGSGFVVDPAGLVVTNLHVIAGQEMVLVALPSGQQLAPTRIEAVDQEHDLVVLRVGAKLPALTLAQANKIVLGQSVIAIGNPLGLEASISEGLVSGVRETPDGTKVLQISAPISPGSSGGPILDRHGEVVGVATFIMLGGQNIGFGVPVRYVKELLGSPDPKSVKQFAAQLRSEAEAKFPKVERKIPRHEVRLLDGCTTDDLLLVVKTLGAAVEVGAPLYNAGDFAACANIYEGATLDLSRKVGKRCDGPRRALAAGRKRAAQKPEDFERAWALRDAFDGLIEVIIRRERARATPHHK